MLRRRWGALIAIPRVLTISSHDYARTHYDVLGVARNASESDIKDAFIKLSKTHHPDMTNNKDAHNRYIRIMEAYTILSKTSTRLDYDNKIFQGPRHKFANPSPWYSREGAKDRHSDGTDGFSYYRYNAEQAAKKGWKGIHEDEDAMRNFLRDHYRVNRELKHSSEKINPIGFYIIFGMLIASLAFQLHLFNKEQQKQMDKQIKDRMIAMERSLKWRKRANGDD